MKKIFGLLVVLFLVLVSAKEHATGAWFEQNPDHVPSLGLSMGFEGQTGSAETPPVSQDTLLYRIDLTLDLRLPISERLTLFGSLSFLGSFDDVESEGGAAGIKTDEFGGGGRIGVRYYFPH